MPLEAVLNIMNDNQTLQPDLEILESCVKAVEETSTNHMRSRRGKATSAPQVRTSKSILTNTANVDAEVAMSNKKDVTCGWLAFLVFLVATSGKFSMNKQVG
ncbi:hypothetical protein E2542_SST21407 [Spatholobus suberectus]|nr:hypothetical protein E2542_SST21407 [Spatholobus suberectus]